MAIRAPIQRTDCLNRYHGRCFKACVSSISCWLLQILRLLFTLLPAMVPGCPHAAAPQQVLPPSSLLNRDVGTRGYEGQQLVEFSKIGRCPTLHMFHLNTISRIGRLAWFPYSHYKGLGLFFSLFRMNLVGAPGYSLCSATTCSGHERSAYSMISEGSMELLHPALMSPIRNSFLPCPPGN